MLNGLLETFKPEDLLSLGIIPVGSGNFFAKDLKINTWKEGIRALLKMKIRKVDVCEYTQGSDLHYFVNLMGLGFVKDVEKTAKYLKFSKIFLYHRGLLQNQCAAFSLHGARGRCYSEEN
jgi:diacylglycerol kinase family enzyme